MQRYHRAPTKRTILALLGSAATTNAYVVDMGPIDCLDNGYTYVMGTNSTDNLQAPIHEQQTVDSPSNTTNIIKSNLKNSPSAPATTIPASSPQNCDKFPTSGDHPAGANPPLVP